MIKCYSDLVKLKTFEERFDYLCLNGKVGEDTFGWDRYLNQVFYRSPEWKKIRDMVIIRDLGCDLGIEGREIHKYAIIHHMNPLTKADIVERSEFLLNPEYLITVTHNTHNAIHYGNKDLVTCEFIERTPGDVCPWK